MPKYNNSGMLVDLSKMHSIVPNVISALSMELLSLALLNI